MREKTENRTWTINTTKTAALPIGLRSFHRRIAIIGAFLALMLVSHPASAEEDCFNGPVPVNGAHRGQINVPQGHAVRLTFNFNAQWENMVFVCDALTGHRILEKGNYSRNREDWVSPIDNTKSLTYYVVAFHKDVSPDAGDAGSHAWMQSPMKKGDRIDVEGQSGAYVDSYGFNDGGGDRWDNAIVLAYFIGKIGVAPATVPTLVLQRVRVKLH